MDIKLLVIFVVLNVVNVVIQTIKSLCTVKCGKVIASIVNAIAYGLYTIVIIYTVCDLPLYLKALIVAIANLIGVYVVKLLEEKMRKDRLWKIEMTIKPSCLELAKKRLEEYDISYNYIDIGKYCVINAYSENQKQSIDIKNIATECNAKYFASECKIL